MQLKEKTLLAIEDFINEKQLMKTEKEIEVFFRTLSKPKIKKVFEGIQVSIFNATDGFFASQEEYNVLEAIIFMESFPERYKEQGYYRTGRGERIPPESVCYRLIEIDTDIDDN